MSTENIPPLVTASQRVESTARAFGGAFVDLARAIDALPPERTKEEHAAFAARVREIAKTIDELAEELIVEVASYVEPHGDA